MDGQSQKVKVVLICGVVIFGGWQMLGAPESNELDNEVSQLMWQAEEPVAVSPSTKNKPPLEKKGSDSTNDLVGNVPVVLANVRPLPTVPRDPGSFESTGWLAVESESVVTKSAPAATKTSVPQPASPQTPPSSSQDIDLSMDLSMKSGPARMPTADASLFASKRAKDPGPGPAVSNPPSVQPESLEIASSGQLVVDRASPFQSASPRMPGVSQVAAPVQFNVPPAARNRPELAASQPVINAANRPLAAIPNAEQAKQKQAPVATPVVEQRAQEHLEYGKSLARRGATFAAREEFVQALRLIAESYDIQSQSREYTTMLADGLRALNEADDFVLMDAEQQLNIDMAQVVASHGSNVISKSTSENLSPINAMQLYFQYSTGKISGAAGRSVAAAEVLHAMGKLLQTSSQYDATGKPMDRAKAMVMFQAALEANPSDFRSANELGVLLAQNGKWEMARELFAKSLVIQKTPESWLNLARAHEQLGEQEFARQANSEYQRMAGNSKNTGNMEWVSAKQFESQGAMPEVMANADVPRTAQKSPAEPESGGNKFINGIKKWF